MHLQTGTPQLYHGQQNIIGKYVLEMKYDILTNDDTFQSISILTHMET